MHNPSTGFGITEAILYAVDHPARDVLAGGAAAGIIMGQRISPQFMDALLLRMGFGSQQTSEPKSEGAPNNLFAPMHSYNQVEGDYSNQAHSRSYYTCLERHPNIKRAILTGSLAGVAVILGTRGRNR